MKEKEMVQIAKFIQTVLSDPENESMASDVKHEVLNLCAKFPLLN
jgi:glycine/serine hydroxymethyltransferase